MKKYLIMFALLIGALAAQTNTLTLEKYVVTASPTGELYFNSPVGKSTFSDSEEFINTPRSVSTIDPTIMRQFNLDSISKLSSFVSGTQTVGSFGQFATVNVRGDLAETYINNQRRTNNSFGFQPSFNGVESVDIVHGAPSVVFGPGFYSGGYINLLTKRATPVAFTNVKLDVGTFAPAGNSFANVTYQIDKNVPINKDTALRISYEGKNNETFYHRSGGKQNTQDLFLTLNHSFGSSTFDINFEYSHQNTPEQIGVNRVTQNLVSNGLYQSGDLITAYDTSEIAKGPLVKLDPTATLMSQGDFAVADVWYLQGTLVTRLSPTTTFENYSLAEYVDRGRFAAYEYLEYARQTTVDNRTEFHFDIPSVYTIIGLDFRFERREVEIGYLNTFFNAHDVSKFRVNSTTQYEGYYDNGVIGMGGRKGFQGPNDYVFDTTLSNVYTISPFIQQRIHLGDKFQLLYGVRADKYYVDVADPLTNTKYGNTETTSYGNTESLIYNFLPNTSVYFTYGHLNAVNASVTGGGIALDPNFSINKKNFHSLNQLYEIGARWQGESSTLGLTGFWQYRQQHNFYTSTPDDIMVRGIELEYKTQPRKNFFAVTNLTYMEANVDNSYPFEWYGNNLPWVDGVGNYRIPGLSRVYANQTLSYRFDNGFGVGSTFLYQSEQSGNGLGGYHIPSQYSINAQVNYTLAKWDITLNVYNVTNQKNWVHNGDFYGDNVVIGRELPVNASLTFTRKF
jgi:outer membrane receptor protein involved in Fe transport